MALTPPPRLPRLQCQLGDFRIQHQRFPRTLRLAMELEALPELGLRIERGGMLQVKYLVADRGIQV